MKSYFFLRQRRVMKACLLGMGSLIVLGNPAVGQDRGPAKAFQHPGVHPGLTDTTKPATVYDPDTAHILGDVNVYTAMLPQVLTSIDPVQIVTRQQPEWQDGLSVSDMLRYFSGVQLKDYGGVGGLKTVDVRSLGTRHTAVLLDGMPLENAQNGQVDLGRYALSGLSSIALYRNQNSQIFQPATAFASSNAIYLASRMDVLDSLHPAKGTVQLKAGSFGLLDGAFNGAIRLSRHWQLQGSVSALTSKGDYKYRYTNGHYDTTLRRDNGDVKRFTLKAGLYGQFQDSSSFSLTAYGFRRQMGLPGAILSNKFTNGERQDESDYYLQTAYFKPLTSKDQLKLQFKYNHSYLRYQNPDFIKQYYRNGDTLTGPLTNHYRHAAYFFSAANLYHLTDNWTVDLSADLHYNHMKMDLNGADNPFRWTGYGALASQIALGDVELAGNLLYTNIEDRQQHQSGWFKKSDWAPSLSLSWQPFKTNVFKIRAFYKNSFQMPTFNDLYLSLYNQADLKPERSTQYNLGAFFYKTWRGVVKSLQVELDGYYNKVDDKIVSIPTTSLFRWQMVNLGLAKIKGLDLTLKNSWAARNWNFLTTLQYSYQNARDYTDRGAITYKNRLPYIPIHSGSFSLSALKGPFGINYSFIYDGERYSERYNSLVSYVPAWYTHDLSLFYKFEFNKTVKTTFLFSVDNVLDQHYDVILHYPMPGRNFKIGAQFEF